MYSSEADRWDGDDSCHLLIRPDDTPTAVRGTGALAVGSSLNSVFGCWKRRVSASVELWIRILQLRHASARTSTYGANSSFRMRMNSDCKSAWNSRYGSASTTSSKN